MERIQFCKDTYSSARYLKRFATEIIAKEEAKPEL
jgi:hypothetical protein